MKVTFLLISIITSLQIHARGGWFCKEAASEKNGEYITSCGIAKSKSESKARSEALKNAFDELDSICNRSVDCKSFELIIEPQRSDCKKNNNQYKCYRAIQARITKTKRKEKYQQGVSLKKELIKLKVQVDIIERDKNGKLVIKCEHDTNELRTLMMDLTTPKKLSNVVNLFKKVPYGNECLSLHFSFIGMLSRGKVKSQEYVNYLLNEIDKIEIFSNDYRASEFYRYLSKFDHIEDNEWETGKKALLRTSTYYLYRLGPFLFTSNQSNKELQIKRLSELVSLAKLKKLGKPVVLKYEQGLGQIFRFINSHPHNKKPWLALSFLKKWGMDFNGDLRNVHLYLIRLFKTVELTKKQFVAFYIAHNINKAENTSRVAEKIISFTESLEAMISKLDDEEDEDIKKISVLNEVKREFLKNTSKKIAKTFQIIDRKFNKKRRTLFCLKHELECPNLVPSKSRLAKMLKSKKTKKRALALEYLIKMPKVTKALEPQIRKAIHESQTNKKFRSHYVIKHGVNSLIEAKTSNPKSLRMISRYILNGRTNYEDLLEKTDGKLVPYFIKEVSKKPNSRKKLFAIKLLGKIGEKAKKAVPVLKKQLEEDKRYFIKNEINKTLELIDGV